MAPLASPPPPFPPAPEVQEKTGMMYHPQTAAPLGRYIYEGDFPSPSAPVRRPIPKKPEVVITARRSTRSSQRGEKKKVEATPEDDDEVEILETISAPIPVPTTPRSVVKGKPYVKAKDKIPAAAAEHLPGPQTILPLGSPDAPLRTHELERLKLALTNPSVSHKYYFFFFL